MQLTKTFQLIKEKLFTRRWVNVGSTLGRYYGLNYHKVEHLQHWPNVGSMLCSQLTFNIDKKIDNTGPMLA